MRENVKRTGKSQPLPRKKAAKKDSAMGKKLYPVRAAEKFILEEADLAELYTHPTNKKIGYIKNGLTKNDLVNLKDKLGLDYDTLSILLSVSRAKLLQKKPDEKFDASTSERIMMLAELAGYGFSVFENQLKFNEWLKTANKSLGGKSPLEIMDTIYGLQEIKNLIGRIEHGVF